MELFLRPNTNSSHFRPTIQNPSHFRLTIQFQVISSPLPHTKVKTFQTPMKKNQVISDPPYNFKSFQTVPIYCLANPQPRERAWNNQRGKKTPHTISNYFRTTIQKPSHFRPLIQFHDISNLPYKNQIMSDPPYKNQVAFNISAFFSSRPCSHCFTL